MCQTCWPKPHFPSPFDNGREVFPSLDAIVEMLKMPVPQNTQYSEVEHKYAADHVHVADFIEWVKSNLVGAKHTPVAGTDIYYRQGENVIRHRYPMVGAGELTVKVRKDANTTTNRVEVDLPLAPKAEPADVERFLHYSGWLPEVTLFKTCNIYEFSHPENVSTALMSSATSKPSISLVIYDIHHLPSEGQVAKKRRRFIEVEVEKSAGISQMAALSALAWWDSKLREAFKLSDPMNESLYELYTEGRYRTVSEEKPKLYWGICEKCRTGRNCGVDPGSCVLACNLTVQNGTSPCGGRIYAA